MTNHRQLDNLTGQQCGGLLLPRPSLCTSYPRQPSRISAEHAVLTSFAKGPTAHFHDAQFFSGEHAEFWQNATVQKTSTRGLRVMPRP